MLYHLVIIKNLLHYELILLYVMLCYVFFCLFLTEEACLHSTLLHKSKFEHFSIKQENICDPQNTVKSGTDLSVCEHEGSEERKLVTACHVKTGADRSLLSGRDASVNKVRRPKLGKTERFDRSMESEPASYSVDPMNFKLQQECSKRESSSDNESVEESDESRNRKVMDEMKHRASQEDSSDTKSRHSKRISEDFDRKGDYNKLRYDDRYECEHAEFTDGRSEEQRFIASPELHSRRRSSHSHDRDNKKWKKKQSKSHRQKRIYDTGFSERLERDDDSSSRHRKRHRSCSTSESSDSNSRSHRYHRSDDRHHRRLSSSRSAEEHRRGSYGKKSRAKRKSRSLSRFATFCCTILRREYAVVITVSGQLYLILIHFDCLSFHFHKHAQQCNATSRTTSLSNGNMRFSTPRKIPTLSPNDVRHCTVDYVGVISKVVRFRCNLLARGRSACT
jgi:hypothetical protein